MFQTYIVQPVFNLLVAIYALIPGHDLGIAVIIFTFLIRLALWPLLKKQLHQTKIVQVMQPKLKKIKQQTKGDKQKEAQMMMELYREHGISPFGSIGVMLIQLPVLFGLYKAIEMISKHPDSIQTFTYPFIRALPHMQGVVHNINSFQETFLGINIGVKPIDNGIIYWPLIVIVIAAAILQYFQSKQLLPQDKDSKSLRQILKDNANGKKSDSADMTASISRSTLYLLPGITFIFGISVQGAIGLYLLAGAAVGIWQQSFILKRDVIEMEDSVDSPSVSKSASSKKDKTVVEAEIIEKSDKKDTNKKSVATKGVKNPKKKRKSGVTVTIHQAGGSSKPSGVKKRKKKGRKR